MFLSKNGDAMYFALVNFDHFKAVKLQMDLFKKVRKETFQLHSDT